MLDNKNYTIGLFLNIQKAFDSIDHLILLQKLDNYGIGGICNNLIKSYLHNRFQFTVINGVKSSYMKICQGVPQVSILGPLLFTLYINDLPLIFKPAHTVLYADDSSIFFKHADLLSFSLFIKNNLSLLGKWLIQNRLHLYVNKCHYILFRLQKSVFNFDLVYS